MVTVKLKPPDTIEAHGKWLAGLMEARRDEVIAVHRRLDALEARLSTPLTVTGITGATHISGGVEHACVTVAAGRGPLPLSAKLV